MSIKLFEKLINQMKDIVDREIGVMDDQSYVIACSNSNKVGTRLEYIDDIIDDCDQPIASNGFTFKYIGKSTRLGNIVFVAGDDEDARTFSMLMALNMANAKQYYDEKYDRANFIKNVMLDNILPGDILMKSKELNLQLDARRVAFLIRTNENNDLYAHDTIRNIFPAKNKDFIIILDEYNIILIKELKSVSDDKTLEDLSKTILDTLNAEALIKVYVGIGTIVNNIKDLAQSYREARIALEVGKVFENENYIISYNKLGIGRLIYQLPTTLCKLFLDEVFKKGSIKDLDDEIILTINKFFENNLNVSETSRQLYVHRNTLVYRLDKIQRITGMDLRNFDDAITFKVSMMVKKYLDSDTMRI